MTKYDTGIVETLRPTFGFIRGSTGVSWFFLPSALQKTSAPFEALEVGMRVKFIGITHPKGPRAIEIGVAPDSSESEVVLL